MLTSPPTAAIYEQLADWHDQHAEPRQRDLFLVLAADAALTLGQRGEAERLRQRLLTLSPYHLLRPYRDFAEALRSADVADYIADLRQQFPPDRAARLRDELLPGRVAGRPVLAEPTRGMRPVPARQHPGEFTSPGSESAPPAWVPALLALLVAMAALAWAAYILIGPFLD